jgi:hypothetical protein
MTNPTSNFGWQMPTPVDLVTDLPADFEVFGQAVDTALADLKGGTTGQVLSKTTNTDMDFTWVAQDDSNAIQNAIVDAKGDLIAATAADTPARLAVGTDYGFLQANSGESTGLAWNNAAWTTYNPNVSSTFGTITSYTSAGYYTRIGKLCVYRFTITITNNGTGSGVLQVDAPFTSRNAFFNSGAGREDEIVGFACQLTIQPNVNLVRVHKYDNAYPGGTNHRILGTISYEVA